MAIQFACPWCTQTISVDDSKAHERVECPYCNRPVKVPTESTHDLPPPLPLPSQVSFMEHTQEDIDRLVEAARDAYRKMKFEYDEQQPDATGSPECWAEAEALQQALKPFAKEEP